MDSVLPVGEPVVFTGLSNYGAVGTVCDGEWSFGRGRESKRMFINLAYCDCFSSPSFLFFFPFFLSPKMKRHISHFHHHLPLHSHSLIQVTKVDPDGVTVALTQPAPGAPGPFSSDAASLIPVHAVAAETGISANMIQRLMGGVFVSSQNEGGSDG